MTNGSFKSFLQSELGYLALLFLMAVVFVFVIPVLPHSVSGLLTAIVIPLLIIVSAATMTRHRKIFIVAALVVTAFEIGSETTDFVGIYYTAKFLRNLFLACVILMYVTGVAKVKEVSAMTILHVLNGYLLLGIVFASLIDFVLSLNPESYTIPGGASYSVSDLNYYTFITLTTVGYGDITPVTPLAKSLTTAIAVSGQFYVAVIIALIVGKFASK